MNSLRKAATINFINFSNCGENSYTFVAVFLSINYKADSFPPKLYPTLFLSDHCLNTK